MRSSAGGIAGRRAELGGGSSFRIAFIVSTARVAAERAAAGEHLVEHGAEEKMSERWSTGRARTCSGDM